MRIFLLFSFLLAFVSCSCELKGLQNAYSSAGALNVHLKLSGPSIDWDWNKNSKCFNHKMMLVSAVLVLHLRASSFDNTIC